MARLHQLDRLVFKEARNHMKGKQSIAVAIRRGEAPDNAHLECMGDEGAAEAAEVGVGHVIGQREHAYPRLPPHLQTRARARYGD